MTVLMTDVCVITLVLVICLYALVTATFILLLSTYTQNVLKIVTYTIFIAVPLLLLVLYILCM